MPRTSPYRVQVTEAEREALAARARKYTSPYRDVIRAKIVLYAADGLSNDIIAARLDTPRQIVSKWRKRFHDERLAGLDEQTRGGAPALFPPASSSRLKHWPASCRSSTASRFLVSRWPRFAGR